MSKEFESKVKFCEDHVKFLNFLRFGDKIQIELIESNKAVAFVGYDLFHREHNSTVVHRTRRQPGELFDHAQKGRARAAYREWIAALETAMLRAKERDNA